MPKKLSPTIESVDRYVNHNICFRRSHIVCARESVSGGTEIEPRPAPSRDGSFSKGNAMAAKKKAAKKAKPAKKAAKKKR
jgi:hypothetical protein